MTDSTLPPVATATPAPAAVQPVQYTGITPQQIQLATQQQQEIAARNAADTRSDPGSLVTPSIAALVMGLQGIKSTYAGGYAEAGYGQQQIVEFARAHNMPGYQMAGADPMASVGQMAGRNADNSLAKGDPTNPNSLFLATYGQVAPTPQEASKNPSLQAAFADIQNRAAQVVVDAPKAVADVPKAVAAIDPRMIAAEPKQYLDLNKAIALGGGTIFDVGGVLSVAQKAAAPVQPKSNPVVSSVPGITNPSFLDDIGARFTGLVAGIVPSVNAVSNNGGGLFKFTGKDAGADYTPVLAATYTPTVPAGVTPSPKATLGKTFYVPYGNYAQEEIDNAKILVDKQTGEAGLYTQVKDVNIVNPDGSYGYRAPSLASGAGRAGLQSGAFTINQSETPVIIQQADAGRVALPSASITDNLSRLGAEAYGGYVLPLDGRTIQSTGAQYSTYLNQNNLANLVSPGGANLSKAQAPGAAIPWELSPTAPVIGYMNDKGIIGAPAPASSGTKSDSLDAGAIVGLNPQSNSPFAASAAEQMVLPKPFVSASPGLIIGSPVSQDQLSGVTKSGYANPGTTPQQPSTLYEDVGNWFKSAPVFGAVYAAGANSNVNIKSAAESFVRTTPILDSIYKAGNVFELKTDSDRATAQAATIATPMITDYQKNVGVYSAALDAYNVKRAGYEGNATAYNALLTQYTAEKSGYDANLEKYNANKTDAGFDSLNTQLTSLNATRDKVVAAQPIAEFADLQTAQSALALQKTNLDSQKSAIDAVASPALNLQKEYGKAASDFMNYEDKTKFATYGVGQNIQGAGDWYSNAIEKPLASAIGTTNPLSQFVEGVVSIPTIGTFLGTSVLVGGEGLLRNPAALPGSLIGGTALQIEGTYNAITTNPAGFAGQLAAMYVVGAGVSAISTKGVGVIRTTGLDYVPIEDIGYDAKAGYPIKPAGTTAADLSRSFDTGVLTPPPTEMSATTGILNPERIEPPYLHGENGIPAARLPNAQPGEPILYTAHESPSLIKPSIFKSAADVGEVYKIVNPGSSELASVSAAPILESYFNKVGNMIPRALGFDSIIKRPTAYATTAEGLEEVPGSIRNQVKSINGVKDYSPIDEYMQARSAEVPAGQAYLPMIKGEYEANIPQNTLIEVTGKNYYTKVGGFGDSHLLGTRVPIIEQRIIGFEPGESVGVKAGTVGKSYSQGPAINLNIAGITGFGSSVGLARSTIPSVSLPTSQAVYPNSERTISSQTEQPSSRAMYSSTPSPSEPAYESYSIPSVSAYSTGTDKISGYDGKSITSVSLPTPLITYPMSPSEPITPISYPVSTTPPRSTVYSGSSPTSPVSPSYGYTPPTSPYSPSSPPSLPVTKLTPLGSPLGSFGGGGGAGGYKDKRRKLQLETFYIGPRSVKTSKAPTMPKMPTISAVVRRK